jgi:hypothetical protein
MSGPYFREPEYYLEYALQEIKKQYGHNASVNDKKKSLHKFGARTSVSTSAESTIMELPAGVLAETYVSDNVIDGISSTATADSQLVTIEGHTISGTNFTFNTQTANLNGVTPVTLDTPLSRVSRMYNSDSTDFAGNIYVYETSGASVSAGVPTVDSKVHMIADGTHNQSQKAVTTTSKEDYLIITRIKGSVNKRTNAAVDLRFKVREKGGVFRSRIEPVGLHTQGSTQYTLYLQPYLIVPPNSDIIMTATATNASVEVTGGFVGVFAKIVD